MFDADNAKKLVSKHFSDGELASKEWLDEQIEKIKSMVYRYAEEGKEECEFVVEAHSEKYPLVKKVMLEKKLKELNFAVEVKVSSRMDKIAKEIYVFKLLWPLHEQHS